MNESNELLTSARVIELGIASDANPDAVRPTTIDATIGKIVTKKGEIKKQSVNIPPRGIAWVMSAERYTLPNNVTGISTLKTTWTRQGILTLTVGIVDPGYDGYLGTAIINFSKNDFALTKGDTFFRTAFFKHEETEGIARREEEDGYKKEVIRDSAAFSDSFLTIDSLAGEIARKLFGLPRIGITIAIVALVLTLLGLALPPAKGLWTEIIKNNVEVETMQEEMIEMQSTIDSLQSRVEQLSTEISPALPEEAETTETADEDPERE